MRVGLLKEIKTLEFRVGLVPAVVQRLAGKGHDVVVETGAGLGVGFGDADCAAAGARNYPVLKGPRTLSAL